MTWLICSAPQDGSGGIDFLEFKQALRMKIMLVRLLVAPPSGLTTPSTEGGGRGAERCKCMMLVRLPVAPPSG